MDNKVSLKKLEVRDMDIDRDRDLHNNDIRECVYKLLGMFVVGTTSAYSELAKAKEHIDKACDIVTRDSMEAD